MSTVRDVVVGGAGVVTAAACGAWAAALAARGLHTVDGLVAASAAAVAAVLGGWYALTAGTLLLARLAARSARCLPAAIALGRAAGAWGAPLLRRAALAGVGTGLALGISPAWATVGAPAPPAVERVADVPADLRPGFLPPADTTGDTGRRDDGDHRRHGDDGNHRRHRNDAAPSTADPDVTEPHRSGAAPTGTSPPGASVRPVAHDSPMAPSARVHVVQPGDSLWSITATSLGPGATARQIAAEWPRWYRTNHAVIGADPDLIHPGQQLLAPDPKDTP